MLTSVFLVTLGALVCFQSGSAKYDCEEPYSFPCTNGDCISRFQWCDTVEDCSDGSDEEFCYGRNGAKACLDIHFKCRNGMCIPMNAVCDNFTDCVDGSDEQMCENLDSTFLDSKTQTTIEKAADYFIRNMTDENGWGNFTSRAIVAMAFADKAYPIEEQKKELMKKHLNVQLMVDLMKKGSKPSLSSLALYVNALYATCQDARNFHGLDLVSLLRNETVKAMESNFTLPITLLALCVADNIDEKTDIYRLTEMYSRSDRVGFKALAIMAMQCIAKKSKRDIKQYVKHFYKDYQHVEKADIYSKALFYQAAISTGLDVDVSDLRKDQLSDGSFGDLLATYNAMPVLLRTSLLDLRCKSSKYEAMDVKSLPLSNTGKELTYSLWITSDSGINTHSLIIPFEGNHSFYDVMRMAAARDAVFNFLFDEAYDGLKIYSLAGIPNDAEAGKLWTLYEGHANEVTLNSLNHLTEKNMGVDKIVPQVKSHYVFWYNRR